MQFHYVKIFISVRNYISKWLLLLYGISQIMSKFDVIIFS